LLSRCLFTDNKKTKNAIAFINWKKTISCYKYSFLEFLATKISFFYNLLMGWRTPIFLKEIKIAKVSNKDKVLHLGCGLLPATSILVAKKTKAKVIGIDNNKNFIKSTKKFVDKHGLSNLIKIEYGDGVEYPVHDFDVIFIAINVQPFDTVLKHLSLQTKKDTRIICRGMNDDIINFIEKGELSDTFSIEAKLQHPKTQSILLMKK